MYEAEVLDGLATAIDETEIPTDRDGLVEAFRLFDRLGAKLSAAVGEFDARGDWGLDGAVSAQAWLRHRTGMAPSAAASTASTASRLRQLPMTRQAWLDGTLSGGQVQAVVANVDNRTVERFAEQEAALVPTLAPLSVLHTTRAMRFWRARAEALLEESEARLPKRSVHLSMTIGARWRLDGDLDPEGGTVLATALRLAGTEEAEGEPRRTAARRRADALVDVCRFFLDHQGHVPAGRHRPHLNVMVDYKDVIQEAGGELVGGGFLDGPTIRRLLCDADVHRVVTDGRSTILDYGTSTRTVPPALWSALVLRDRHCRLGVDCDRPPEWCEAHHLTPVAEGGETNLGNLALGCSRHHHLVHLPGWQLEMLLDGTLVITDPGGRTRTTRPPGVLPSSLAA